MIFFHYQIINFWNKAFFLSSFPENPNFPNRRTMPRSKGRPIVLGLLLWFFCFCFYGGCVVTLLFLLKIQFCSYVHSMTCGFICIVVTLYGSHFMVVTKYMYHIRGYNFLNVLFIMVINTQQPYSLCILLKSYACKIDRCCAPFLEVNVVISSTHICQIRTK